MSVIRSRRTKTRNRTSQDPAPYFIRQVSGAITATASATPHTKGAWVEIVSATTDPTTLIEIWGDCDTTATATATLIDIGIGAAAAEVAVVSDIPIGSWVNTTGSNRNASLAIPLAIPTGSRVAVRMQSVVVSHTATISIAFSSGGWMLPAATAATMGADPATSRGVYVGGVTTYTQIVASTADHYRYLVMVPSASSSNIATGSTYSYVLGVGAAASEVERGRIYVEQSTAENIGPGSRFPVWPTTAIVPGAPAGSRVAIKTSSASNVLDFAVIGIPY